MVGDCNDVLVGGVREEDAVVEGVVCGEVVERSVVVVVVIVVVVVVIVVVVVVVVVIVIVVVVVVVIVVVVVVVWALVDVVLCDVAVSGVGGGDRPGQAPCRARQPGGVRVITASHSAPAPHCSWSSVPAASTAAGCRWRVGTAAGLPAKSSAPSPSSRGPAPRPSRPDSR